MNPANIHIALTHFPIAGVVFSCIFLIIALIQNKQELKKIALWFTLLCSLTVLPVYFSGESAEEMLEHKNGYSEQLIEAHEEFATIPFVFIIALGLFSFIALKMKKDDNKLFAVVIILSIISSTTILYTAKLGGRIKHDEIRKITNQ